MFLRPDGVPIWVRLKQAPLFVGDRMAGLILRLTENDENKRLLDEVNSSREQLMQAERIARIGSWTWDREKRTTSLSDGLRELFGRHTDDLLSLDLDRLAAITHPEDFDRLRRAVRSVTSGEESEVSLDLRQLGEHGWMWVRMRARATHDDSGAVVRVSGTHQDITRARDTDDQLQDLVTQNSLMQAVASAANEAATLDEVLVHAQAMVVLHDDWDRGRAFFPTGDGDLAPRYYSDDDRRADLAAPEVAQRELETARTCLRERATVWDPEHRLTIAFPVMVRDEVLAVVTITSLPPLYRHDMIRGMVEQAGVQLSQVAERELSARQLADARDRALEASQHKSDFLATMSHEIRTPLNGIIGLNELLDRTTLDDQQRHLSSGIAVSGRALLSVINDILDFSKIEAGQLEIETVDFEVRDVFEQAAGVLAESARAKGLDLQVSCHPDVPEVLGGDPTRLQQVLTNLGSNAVKFTSAGSVSIRATAEPTADGDVVLRVEVRDTGIGIPEEQRLQVFRPFAQADASTTRRFGGTGLGLAISAEIVEASGGEIGVESEVGVGSTFWFTVRLHRPTGSRFDARLRRTRELLGGARVLVVDDNPQNRLILGEQLNWWHVTSTGVADAAAARDAMVAAAAAGTPYDAVLLDLAMPAQDGLAFASAVRADGRLSRVPLVLLSSSYAPDETRLRSLGIVEALTKPVQAPQLRDTLLRVLTGEEIARSEPPEQVQGTKRVLVVEDNPVNQIVARGLLVSLGYVVDTADDGQEALELTALTPYDAVLMDLQMPRLDGYAATQALREREALTGAARLPVLAMTAAAVSGERERCLAAGMDDFITKPVAPATLAEALARWTGEDGPMERPLGASSDASLAGAPGTTSSHLDMDRLEMLRELSPEDNAYLDRVIDGFVARSPGALERIAAAVAASDADQLSAEAHSVKGTALNIGLPTVGEISAQLEALGRTGSTAGAADLVLRLEATVADAQEALLAHQEWYRSLPPGWEPPAA